MKEIFNRCGGRDKHGWSQTHTHILYSQIPLLDLSQKVGNDDPLWPLPLLVINFIEQHHIFVAIRAFNFEHRGHIPTTIAIVGCLNHGILKFNGFMINVCCLPDQTVQRMLSKMYLNPSCTSWCERQIRESLLMSRNFSTTSRPKSLN